LRHDTLRGAAFEDSPLVRRRSHASFGVALSWVFATSERRVDVAE
jgi:outer membrane protein